MMAIFFEFLGYVYLLYAKKKIHNKASNILKQDIIMCFSPFVLLLQISSHAPISRAAG